jgi:hypothetical protein
LWSALENESLFHAEEDILAWMLLMFQDGRGYNHDTRMFGVF